jgi:hypothetical protein
MSMPIGVRAMAQIRFILLQNGALFAKKRKKNFFEKKCESSVSKKYFLLLMCIFRHLGTLRATLCREGPTPNTGLGLNIYRNISAT